MSRHFITSSFQGTIPELPGISVDNFERAYVKRSRAYFLSHYHLDHIQGLHSEELLNTLEETKARIYMTELSAAIVKENSNDGPIMQYIEVLKLGTTSVRLPRDDERGLDELYVNVVAMPAGHCLGSVMYLFKTKDHTVLFTGDFRINIEDLSKYAHLHKDGEPITLDALYVDTTFMNEKFENFPKRSTSIEHLIEEIRKWLSRGDANMVALRTSANYGYEFVFNEIYRRLNMEVYVSERMWKIYSGLPHIIKGVTNNFDTRIHLCRSGGNSHAKCVPKSGDYEYLYINLSALTWDSYEEDVRPIKWLKERHLKVCFATHCSSRELHYFVNYFSPARVVGFPYEYVKSSGFVEDE